MIKRYVGTLIQHEIIAPEENEIIAFGLKQGLSMLVNIATTVLIGVLFGMWWQSIVFLLVYSPLRVFAGGVHAKTPLRCYIASIALVVLFLLAVQCCPKDIYLLTAIFMASAGGVFCLAPIEDKNKPLDELESKVYKKRTRIILFIEIVAIIILIACDLTKIAVCIVISIFLLDLMLMLGKLKNMRIDRETRNI